jgi:hypothetical protein
MSMISIAGAGDEDGRGGVVIASSTPRHIYMLSFGRFRPNRRSYHVCFHFPVGKQRTKTVVA